MALCNSFHKLKKTKYTQLKKNNAYASGYTCHHCQNECKRTKSYHCKLCMFDLCKNCFIDTSRVLLKCDSNHRLVPFYCSNNGFTCDECNESQASNSLLYGCRKCDWDLCSNCYENEKEDRGNGNNQKKNEKRKKNKKAESKQSESSTASLWSTYADKEDPTMMSEEGMIAFFGDCGVNPESADTLLIAFYLESTEMGIVDEMEFAKKFVNAKNTKSFKNKMKKEIDTFVKSTKNDKKQFNSFYKWLFQHAKEDEKKRNIPTDLAHQLWNIVLTEYDNKWTYLSSWIEFVAENKDKDLKVVSKDLWIQIFDFLQETKDIETYDDLYGWPVAIDEFVEWHKEKKC